MSLAEYRSVGMSNGIPKVLAALHKEKVSLTDIRTALVDDAVLTALKKVNGSDILAIKAVLTLYRRKGTLALPLSNYYDFILGRGTDTIESLYEDIVNSDKDGQWKDFIEILNGLISKSAPIPAASVASEPSIPSVASIASEPSIPSVASIASEPSMPSVASVPSVPSVTESQPEPSLTKSTISLKVKVKAPVQVQSLNLTDKEGLKGTVVPLGYKIHVKDGHLNKEKHTESMLKEQCNASAKLLVVDIESCTDVIYPIAIDLAPDSSNKDVLDYVVKVLTEATQKNLKCHSGSSLHVYTVRTWTDSPRVLYISVAK